MMRQTTRIMLHLAVLACVASGCGGTMNVKGDRDAEEDATPDPVLDLVTDAEDAAPDPGEDGAPVDAIPDPAEDAPPEAAPDTAPDPVPDPTGDTGPGTGLAGDPCTSGSDCMGIPSDTRFCMDYMWGFIPFPGGYCSAWCGSSSDCGTGAGCVVGQCFKRCTDDSECRTSEGYTCRVIPYVTTDTYCLPPMS